LHIYPTTIKNNQLKKQDNENNNRKYQVLPGNGRQWQQYNLLAARKRDKQPQNNKRKSVDFFRNEKRGLQFSGWSVPDNVPINR